MLVDFNQKEAITIPGMNHGTGTMTAKMYMDEQGKVIPCSIHAGGSIGLHKHATSDDINYVVSGTGKAICDGQEEILTAGTCHICKKGSAQGETAAQHEISVTFEGGIRYTVPASIDPARVADDLVIRFRVGGVMKKRVVRLLLDGETAASRKRPVMAPGEMEELKLTKEMLDAHPGLSSIHITVEEA